MKLLLRERIKEVNPGSHECHENEHLSVMRHRRPKLTKSRHQRKIYYPWAPVSLPTTSLVVVAEQSLQDFPNLEGSRG